MNYTKPFRFTDILKTLLFTAIFSLLCLSALAAVPWTAGEFPQWFASDNIHTTNLGTAETNLFQTLLPASPMGNNGTMTISLDEFGDGVATTKTFTVYLGGSGTASPPTDSTPIFTNTITSAVDTLVTRQIVLRGSPSTNYIFSPVPGTITPYTVVLNTGTNLLLTVTGSGAAATNSFGFNSITIKSLSLP